MKPSIQSRLEQLVERFEEVNALLSDASVIANQDKFRDLSREFAEIEPVVKCFQAWRQSLEDIDAATELANDGDADMREMAEEELASARARSEELDEELQRLMLPKDPNDTKNVFLEIRAGTGGDEAAIFAGDLFRMYSRYAEKRRWQVEVLSENEGEHGGFKEIIARLSGDGVYGTLKFESGAHRVQRVPETESQGRIHTSACTVAVMPEADEAEAVEINKADLRVDTFRSSGAGGQHVNRTDSAVRLTYLFKDDGGTEHTVVTQCQSERSQHQNKDKAMKMLQAKVYELEMQRRNAEKQALENSKADIGWGSQIRSYVLDDARIKDLRTGVENRNTQAVLDGALDPFIEASLKAGL